MFYDEFLSAPRAQCLVMSCYAYSMSGGRGNFIHTDRHIDILFGILLSVQVVV